MTPDEKRVKIAEACGWRFIESKSDDGGSFSGWWKAPSGLSIENGYSDDALPDYIADLNAMHEAEKAKDMLWNTDYVWWLGRITAQGRALNPDKQEDADLNAIAVFATAAQRAEAFGLTLKLW